MKFSLVVLSFLGSLAVCHADAVRLTINGPDGKPVAGAKVRVVESKGAWYRREYLPARDFESDAQGLVTLESKGALITEADRGKVPDDSKNLLLARVLAPGLAVRGIQLKGGDNTVALAPGRALEGVALGEDEKPIASAHFLFSSLPWEKGTFYRLPDTLALVANTDAQGKWKFESMPLEGRVTIKVEDARFKREDFSLDAKQKTPPLFLSQGVTIKGRLLKPDGTGAAGIKIYAGDFEHQPVTDANGRFVATGIGESSVALQIVGNEQKLPFIVNYQSVEDLKPGEVRDVGDWKTIKAVHVKGTVVSKATKKPVSGATISSWGRGTDSNSESDKTGVFDLLASPDVSNVSVRASGFRPYSKMNVPDAKNGVIDVGMLELEAGKKVKGVLVDEEGNPVLGMRLYASARNGGREYAWTDQGDGSFSFDGIEDGSYTITVSGYELASEAKFNVGTVATPALRVVLKGKAGRKLTEVIHSIEGRVVDGEGAPVAGAKIAMRVQDPSGSYSSPNAISQSDGSFKTSLGSFNKGTLKVLSIVRPGFVRGAEKIEPKDGDWRVDLTVQKRGGALKGRIVGADGKPVTGAFVGLQNSSERPIATDESGAFSLPDAPQTGITLLVSNGPSLAMFTPQKAGEPIEITLPAVEPVEDKVALADQLLAQGRLSDDWEEQWDALGWKRIEDTYMHRSVRGWSWTWEGYLEALARHEPQVLLEREAELRAKMPADTRNELDVLLMQVRASSKDEGQREQARNWLVAQEKEKRDISAGTVSRLLQLASVGSRLDKKTGDMWLDYAVQVAGQLDAKQAGEYSWSWAPVAARISPEAPSLLAQDWSSTAQLQFLASAMGTWATDKNLEAGRKGWEQMQELAADANQNPDPNVQVEGFQQKPSDLLSQGRSTYARLLAYSDPKAALGYVGAMDDYQKAQLLQTIAQQAVKQKKYEVAKEAIVAIGDVPIGNVEFVAYAAGLAQQFDETLAAPLWDKAYARARPSDEETQVGWSPSLGAYAQERASKWPGESRILIEREWAKRVAVSVQPNNDDDFDQNGRSMQTLAEAMARLNPRRAIEMADKITEKQDLRAQTRGSIAATLLTK